MIAAAVALSSTASGFAAWKVIPLTLPEPSTSTRAPDSSSAWEVYGSQIAQASTWPPVNAASASAGWRFCTSMSS